MSTIIDLTDFKIKRKELPSVFAVNSAPSCQNNVCDREHQINVQAL
jgi:hypothetical protein